MENIERYKSMPKTVHTIFVNKPTTWGLRGDPHLWDAMEQKLSNNLLPENSFVMLNMLKDTFKFFVEQNLDEVGVDKVFVPQFKSGEGHSDGYVSLTVWRDKLIPYLMQQYFLCKF